MPELSLIIPAYNESESLPNLVKGMQSFCTKDIEVIIVDNGSSDNTFEIGTKLTEQFSFLKIVRTQKNLGYGGGILLGLSFSKGNYLAWTHADLQTDPKDVLVALKAAKAFAGDNVFVKGVRKNRSLIPALLSLFMQISASLILKTRLTEINAQPKLFTRKLYYELHAGDPPKDFSLDLFTYLLAIRSAATVIEIPVDFASRQFGEAKGGGASLLTIAKISARTLGYIMKMRNSLKESKYENRST